MLPLVALAILTLSLSPSAAVAGTAVAGEAGGHGGGDSYWHWTGAGACPHYCTCFKRRHLRHVECVARRLAGVDVGLPRDTEAADLSHNLISSLEDGCFQELGLVQLRELHLQNNAIRTVGPWAFTGLRRLRVLDLSFNHLQTLYANTFAANRGLNTLILAGNNLARLPPDQPLPAAPRLQVLDLSSCRLAHVGAVVLSEMPALANLNLSGNFLIQLQPQALAAQRQLQLLDLTRNPLACDVNTRQYVKQLEARNVTVRQSCPAQEEQIVSKSMARILADIDDTGWEGVAPRPDDGVVVARPTGGGGTRTHEAMLDMTEGADVRYVPAPPPDDLNGGALGDYDLDEEDRASSQTTVSPRGHKDCRTLFPERNTNNPDLMREWFDPIPSFWAGVIGCQVGLVLGLCLSACLCRRSFWRALCSGSPHSLRTDRATPAPLDDHAPLRDRDTDSLNSRDSSGSAESTPCLWRDSVTSLERLQRSLRPETPPPAYEDLVRGRGRVRLA